ncbi:MAG: heme-degrading domain-containing protein [Acidobacteriota bacterium]|nr:heme-degrading domain-containing protein [Acidobacteriota bacterium]
MTPADALAQDIAALVLQESTLTLQSFSPETAWQLGSVLRELAVARGLPLVIDVRRFGNPDQPLFYSALPGTTPDNPRWIARKARVVARFHKSSYHVGRLLEQAGRTFGERYTLPEEEYAAHGGAFPLKVAEAGIVGCVAVSGLPQRDDHNLVIEALCLLTGRSHDTLRLPA